MKKKLIYSILMVSAVSATSLISSCKKYLTETPQAAFSQQAAFGNVSLATDVVMGVYAKLTGDSGYGIRVSMYYPYDSDEILGAPNTSATLDGDRRDIARYGATASNAQIEAPFEGLYTGIERANICIKYIPLMPQYTNGTAADQAALKRLYGEVLTLRAQFYFELIRNWGDLPAQFVPSADMPTLVIPKTNRDVIYDHLLNDLLTAEPLLPWRTDNGVARDERITKGVAKGLRARLALFRGGYSLRNDTKIMERRSDFLKYYQIAKDECADVIASNAHSLNASYQALWKNYVCAHTLDPNGEIMFEVAMAGGSGISDSKLGYYNGPRLTNAASAATTGTITTYGNSTLLVLPTYFYSFDPNDTRRDVTVAPYYFNLDGSKVLQKLVGMFDGKFRRDWITNPSFNSSASFLTQYFGLNWPILRYSDILLMYAEADNEIGNGPSTNAIAYFNQVRSRGFGGAAIGVTPTTHDAFFTAIQNERFFEFGGEGIRKYDLIRWNLLNTNLTATRANLALMMNKQAPYASLPQSMYYLPGQQTVVYGNSLYAPTPSATPTGYTKIAWVSSITNTGTVPYIDFVAKYFTPNHSELLPIPQPSLDANPLLTQNPGY
ncbi:putative outer membrane starch-binding protein [Mucilaginibacter gracilis]|uniref:Putative outer membrane starch-binding protein n=1 Tax=Mucilaginibacter gracilis TaxID=423350 RepID=A0A495IZF0_9SPHI|nr:RagB/SusD family nutrient uptake outer membrane protein [Mucilaginibacter gracilis]RKR81478.1 putative outer membrane starch-binding protein [Mucilaginibacter gracilis]